MGQFEDRVMFGTAFGFFLLFLFETIPFRNLFVLEQGFFFDYMTLKGWLLKISKIRPKISSMRDNAYGRKCVLSIEDVHTRWWDGGSRKRDVMDKREFLQTLI